ncbi:MAG: hypothetical protein VX294_08155 [Candidatus Latescibacterota bacterium]|nr:hypothetical protein [Candidatus Latescibacterota bacterium]
MLNRSRIPLLAIVIMLFFVTFVSAVDLQPVLPVCCTEVNESSVRDFSLKQKIRVRDSVPSLTVFRSSVLFTSVFTVAGGIIAYWNKKQADRAYRSYLRTANSSKLQNEFTKAERLDKLAGSALVAMELGIGMTTYLIFFCE